MKRIFILAAVTFGLLSCNESSTKNGLSKDTTAPTNATKPTATNPGGLKYNGGATTTDSTNKNTISSDSMHK